jgi:hypothetical protein
VSDPARCPASQHANASDPRQALPKDPTRRLRSSKTTRQQIRSCRSKDGAAVLQSLSGPGRKSFGG